MAELNFRNIKKAFGTVTAIDDVSLDIASGEFLTLVGASGCGKTTLLRVIAGFTRPDSGELAIDGTPVGSLPPSKRGVGFVFQSYALFPTQTVAQNIGFSLRIRHLNKAEIAQRVQELCTLTQLTGMEDRYPHELSGGQQQRVALARALAPNPSILLLDEPLAALDAKIRAHLRAEIRSVVDRLGITTIYVTHDQEEALSISDRVAVMDAGRIMQVGAPIEVYLRPTGRFVASFIGTVNELVGRPAGDGILVIEGHSIEARVPGPLESQDEVTVSVRPENITLTHPEPGSDGLSGKLTSFSFLGQSIRARVTTGEGQDLVADVPIADWLAIGVSAGDEVACRVRPGGAMVFSPGDDVAPRLDDPRPEREQ